MQNIQCEKCQTQFPVDPAKIPSTGTKARCGKCGHVFTVFPASTTPKETPAAPSIQDMILADLQNESPAVAPAPVVPPPAQPFKVSSEALLKYQNRMNQSFKKSAPNAAAESIAVAPLLSKAEGHRHALVLTAVAIAIFLTGMAWRSGSLSPARWFFAVREGLPARGTQLSPDRVRTSVFQFSDFSRTAEIDVDLVNTGSRSVSSATLSVQLYRPDASALTRQEASCCSAPVAPNARTNVRVRVPLPQGSDVGSYDVSVSNEK